MPKVSNPLTIIAIFAGLAEVAMTVTVGLLDGWNQTIFMWFAAIFPIGIAAGFFTVLMRKPALLYAPSDWQDESNAYKSYHQEGEMVRDVQFSIEAMVERLSATQESITKEEVEKLRNDADEALQQIKELKEARENQGLEIEFFSERHLVGGNTAKVRQDVLNLFRSSPSARTAVAIQRDLVAIGASVPISILRRELDKMKMSGLLVSSVAPDGKVATYTLPN